MVATTKAPKAGNDQLLKLAAAIRRDLGAAKVARVEQLKRFWSAGQKLTEAKKAGGFPPREWGKWVKDRCKIPNRTAQRLMAFSKCDAASPLEELAKAWREVNGHKTAPVQGGADRKIPARKKGGGSDPEVPVYVKLLIPESAAEEVNVKLEELMKLWPNTTTTGEAVVEAVRFAFRELVK